MNTTSLTCGVCRRSATLNLSYAEKLARVNPHMRLTKHQLFTALGGNGRLNINGVPVTLSNVQREDGSGSSFNLLVYAPDGTLCKSYCRTID